MDIAVLANTETRLDMPADDATSITNRILLINNSSTIRLIGFKNGVVSYLVKSGKYHLKPIILLLVFKQALKLFILNMNTFKTLLFSLIFLIFYQSTYAQKKGTIDVYLIGGQSNATGQGYLRNMDDSMRIDTTVLMFHSGKPHLNSGKEAFVWQPLSQASESPDRFGLELGFGSKIRRMYPNRKIALIKHAHSATDLYNQWNPGKNSKDVVHWGIQFKVFVQTVDSGLNELHRMGYKPVIRGMLWQQGENDAVSKDSASIKYAQNLIHFIERVRKQFNAPKMPFVYGYVLPPPNAGIDRDLVRKAEHDIDQNSKTPLAVKRAIVVQTDDLSQRADDKNSPYPQDHIHFGTNGTWTLGVRMAATAWSHR